MGFYEEESKGTPPPWGWPRPQEKNGQRCRKIVYDGSFHATSYKEIHLQIFSQNMYKVTSGWLVVSD